MSRLSREARAMLELVRDVDEPTVDDRQRIKKAVIAAAATGGVVAASGTALAAKAGSASTSLGIASVSATALKAVAVLTVVSATAGVAVVQPWRSSPSAEESPAATVSASRTPSTAAGEHAPTTNDAVDDQSTTNQLVANGPALPSVSPPEPQARPAAALRHPEPSARRPGPTPPASPEPEVTPTRPSLAEELLLLRAAHAALSAGRPREALAPLSEHRVRFANGQLAAERDGTEALALCGASDARGATIAEQFLRVHARSPLADRVRTACGLASRSEAE